MSDEQGRLDSCKSRQELLDEVYYLRDVAGEREQRAADLEKRLADMTAALHRVLGSRSWRITRPLRHLLHARSGDAIDQALTELVSEGVRGKAEESAQRRASRPLYTSVAEPKDGLRCMFVDVTELALRHGQTGIQRVVREIARALLAAPPEGFAVELVYAPQGQPYRYARTFAAGLRGKQQVPAPDAPIAIREGDIFLGLDHAMDAVLERAEDLAAMRASGAKLYFVLNDTLPLSNPGWFPVHVSATFEKWFATVTRIGDGIACISRSTQTDARDWMERLGLPREHLPVLRWFHLGVNCTAKDDDAAITPDHQELLDRLCRMTSFLMVGTLEPRKGHAQTLEAFNRLWADGEEVVLVLVGRPGWMTEVIQRRIRHHDEFGRHLFWFQNAGDTLLDKLYAVCTVLLAASEGEGFGLPLIEAARHGLPILCRDLRVFREVAGGYASYFSCLDAEGLASAIDAWLEAHRRGVAPSTIGMPCLTWAESARDLLAAVLDQSQATPREGSRSKASLFRVPRP